MNAILDYFRNLLQKIGLFKKNASIVFLGLDNAGKSTLLTLLTTQRITQLEPTKHEHAESVKINNVIIKVFDLGGHLAMRKIWKQHFLNINGIVYVVDTADSARFEESKKEFEEILQSEELKNIPIVIFGNKIDKKEARSEDELLQLFNLKQQSSFGTQILTELNGKPVKVCMGSVVRKTGIKEMFDWLTTKI